MKKSGCLVLAAFLGGIILANLAEEGVMTSYGILNTYFLNQYSYKVINYDSLFCHILFVRLEAVLFLLLLGNVLEAGWFQALWEGAAAAVLGFLMTAAIANLGVKGILLTLAGLLPQWIFYLAALFMYTSYSQANRYAGWNSSASRREFLVRLGFFALTGILLLAGIVTESYINPVLLKKVIKIF